MEKRVCITGATGFLGVHMVLAFLERGWEIIGITESESLIKDAATIVNHYGKEKLILFQSIDWRIADIRQYKSLLKPFEGAAYVVHCAGVVHEKKSSLLKINQQGAANVVKACIANKVPKLCHVSTIEALGRYWNLHQFDETTPYKKSSLTSNYAHSKYLGEKEALKAALHGVDVVVMIPPVVIGPSNWKDGFGLAFSRIYDGVNQSPQGNNAFVDVRDLAQIAVLFHQRKMSGRYLVNESNHSYQEAYQIIGHQLGLSGDFSKSSAIKIRILARLCWPFFTLFGLQLMPQFFMTRIRNIQKNSYSAKKFKDETSYEFIPFEQSLRFAADAFLKDRTPS